MAEKQDRISMMKKVHGRLMEMKDGLLSQEQSIVDKIEISRDGAVLVFGQAYGAMKMRIHENDYEEVPVSAVCFGDYEKEETEMVCRVLDFFKEEGSFTVFDIGANVGWYTLNIRKRFPNMSVYSFEPSPITYNRLVDNLTLNGLDSDQAYHLGFYKESGQLDFYYDGEGSGASSLVNLREKDSVTKISVDMQKMDDWVREASVSRVDFIKCDVEGSEFFVYQGGKAFIEQNKPIVFSEMLRKWSAKFHYTPNDIIHFMAGMGYGCFVIANDKLKECPVVDDNTIETNYFFMHREKHLSIITALCGE